MTDGSGNAGAAGARCLRVAQVGVGAHGQGHAEALRLYADSNPGQIELAAVCDRDATTADGARDTYGFTQSFTTLDRLLATTPVDALVIIMPIAQIVPVARELLPRRIPMLIEKPLGTSIEEARGFADEATASAAPIMVSLNRRFMPSLVQAREWIRDKGPLRYMHGSMLRHARTEPSFVWGTGIHLLDGMCAVAGPLRMVEAGARAFACNGAVGLTAPLAGPDDCVASVEIVPACGREEDRIHLSGPQYAIEMWTPLSYPWRIRIWENGALVKDEEANPEAPYIESAGVYGETDAFLSAVREGTDPRPDLSDAMPGSELAAQLQAVVDQSILPTD